MDTPACFSSDLIEVFKTEKGVIYQSDRECCLFVDFGGKIARYSYPCLQRLRDRLKGIDINEMFYNPRYPDVELVIMPACDHCYVLSALDILYFQELLDGAFVMFELNHIVKDCLQRLVA